MELAWVGGGEVFFLNLIYNSVGFPLQVILLD